MLEDGSIHELYHSAVNQNDPITPGMSEQVQVKLVVHVIFFFFFEDKKAEENGRKRC